jgi:AcrR family transcriptional regulator
MVTAANRGGYARANVSEVIAAAKVSRGTFYEYFADKDACFLATLADVRERLTDYVGRAVEGTATEEKPAATLAAMIDFAIAEPAMARFLTADALAGSPAALDERDRAVAEVAEGIDDARKGAPPGTVLPDVPSRVLVGGVSRLVGSRLRRGDPGLSELREALLLWIKRYERPVGEHRWRTMRPTRLKGPAPVIADPPLRPPRPLGPGRPRLSAEEVAKNHRERILLATARLAETNGYTATTVAQITKLAKVDARAFYGLFADKQEAFMTVHELGFQHLMAVTAGAFFAGATWPERSWQAARAFTFFLESYPNMAHVGFVEAYAAGPGAVQRVEDSHVAFTIFLREGYQYSEQDDPPSRVALEAIIATVFEVIYEQSRKNAQPKMTGVLPAMMFLWLAPFMGVGQASEFIEGKLKAPART